MRLRLWWFLGDSFDFSGLRLGWSRVVAAGGSLFLVGATLMLLEASWVKVYCLKVGKALRALLYSQVKHAQLVSSGGRLGSIAQLNSEIDGGWRAKRLLCLVAS